MGSVAAKRVERAATLMTRDMAVLTDSAAQSRAPSMVERVTAILDVFNMPLGPLSLEEVTQLCGLPRSTTHRILWQLMQSGWVVHVDNRYSLGPRAMRLGARELVHEQLRSASSFRLRDLAHRSGLVVHLACMDGNEIYYLDKFTGPNAPEVPSDVGRRAPAHCTAAGKAMLAQLAPEVVHDLYPAGVLPRRTPRSVVSLGILHQELARTRTHGGLAVEQGECFEAVSCAGAAVRGPSGRPAAISIAAPVGTRMDRLGPIVLATAKAISADLFRSEMSQPPARAAVGM